MRKKISMTMAAVLCVMALSGCQKAPEASDDQEIPHARGALEQEVARIAGENTEETPQEGTPQQPGGVYEGTIGTTDNKMHISAQIPAIPANVYQITLVPNENLDMDALTALLDSQGGQVEDTSQEMLEEIQQSEYSNLHSEDGEACYYSVFGDHSGMRLTNGGKEALFSRHTYAGYLDSELRDTYYEYVNASSKDEIKTTFIPVDQADGADGGTGFSVREAEQILLDKLEPLGITEIVLSRITRTEGSGHSYYELQFVPSYEGTAVISEVVWSTFGEIYPNGFAIVTPEGVADLQLFDFCGKTAGQEPVTVLSFEQVEKILEQYLDNRMIQADERLVLNNIKLEYYPVPNPSPEAGIEYRPELELIPVWHIYMTLDDYMEFMESHDFEPEDALYNIWINAVTGEIEQVR